jgi:hypothetical protein
VSAVATLAGLHASELILLLAILLAIGLLIWALFPRVGILSLELATSAARAKAIVGARSRDGRLGAMRLNVYLDFPFLVVYSTMLAVAVVLAGRAATSSELISKEDDQVVAAFVLGALTAGVCDAIENGALLGMLSTDAHITDRRARVATVFAVLKLVLVAVTVGWILSIPVASLVSLLP